MYLLSSKYNNFIYYWKTREYRKNEEISADELSEDTRNVSTATHLKVKLPNFKDKTSINLCIKTHVS